MSCPVCLSGAIRNPIFCFNSLKTMDDLVISASAGTGKTYQLARRYLQLLLSGESPQNILATTFTKKAAGEIQDRILSILAKASVKDDDFKALLGMLGENNNPAQLTREQVQDALKSLLKNLNRLNISTLDSFFSQRARCFSLELGLPMNWQIMDESKDKEYRQAVLSDLLQENDVQEDGSFVRAFLQYVRDGELKRSVFDQLSTIVNDLYSLWREAPDEAWNALKVPNCVLDDNAFLEFVNSKVEEFYALLEDLNEQLAVLSEKEANAASRNEKSQIKKEKTVIEKKGTLVNNLIKKEVSVLTKEGFLLDNIFDFLKKPFVGRLWNVRDSQEKSVQYNRTVIQDADILDLLNEIALRAAAYVKSNWFKRSEFYRLTLERFHKKYLERKKNAGALIFDDIPWLLTQKGLASSEMNDSDSFRMDGSIRHLLLDEFQDTSLTQWRVLAPLAARLANGEDSSFFCVGDTKQAIYGWRGGEAKLLDSLPDWLKIPKKDLSKSFRSRPTIIDTVNTVFQNLNDNPILKEYADSNYCVVPSNNSGSVWDRDFEKHESSEKLQAADDFVDGKTRERKVLSYVEFSSAPMDDVAADADSDEEGNSDKPKLDSAQLRMITYQKAAQRIKELYVDSQDLNLSIGVLVKRNIDGAIIADLIKEQVIIDQNNKEQHLECSLEGKSSLLDSYEVCQILALLKWIDHPGDVYSYYIVSQSALAESIIEENRRRFGVSKWFTSNDEKKPPVRVPLEDVKMLNEIRYNLFRDGYGLTVQRWAEILKKDADKRDVRRLEIFEELANKYDSMGSTRTDDFVAYIESAAESDSLIARIQIMTYHKSKGLQFDIVVLPELDTELSRGADSCLVVSGHEDPDDPSGETELSDKTARFMPNKIIRYVNKDYRYLLPPEQQDYFKVSVKKDVQESLCNLYVAMTRAKQALYMIVPPYKSGSYDKTYEDVLFGALTKKEDVNSANQDENDPDRETQTNEKFVTRADKEPGIVYYSIGDPNWIQNTKDKKGFDSQDDKAVQAAVYEVSGGEFAFKQSNRSVCVPLPATSWTTSAKPSSFVNVVTAEVEASSGSALSQNLRGTLFHCWLADIKWLEDYRVDDQRLIDLGVGIGLQQDSFMGLLPAFKSLLKHPNVISALKRPNKYWEAYMEKDVAGILKDNEETDCLVSGVIDRLTVHRTAGKIDKAIILDFKTVHKGSKIAEIRARYAGQMDAYRQIVSKMYNVSSVETTLLILEGDF